MPEARDLPLLRWGDELRRARMKRRRLRAQLAIGAAGIGLLGFTVVDKPLPRLVWNVSASAPVGLYGVMPGAPLRLGDMVVAWTPIGVRELAARRHYLPANVPLVKRVAAVPDDFVCAIGEQMVVNGSLIAVRSVRDGRGRPMPWWTGCRALKSREYLLLTDAPASFDGRYFGPVGARDIVGKAVPLWVR